MEIKVDGESKALLKPGLTLTFGRGQGFNSTNNTVSRRHISFLLLGEDEDQVLFQVIGKNPIWKHSKRTSEVQIFRHNGKGEMEVGDMFCVSAQNPIWFTLKKVEENSKSELMVMEKDLDQSLENPNLVEGIGELDIDSVDISNFDPIKEFGLVVMGHEFDGYGKKIKLDARKWDWFVDEHEGGESDEDADDVHKPKGKRRVKRKKKNGDEQDDDEWTGESEEEIELLAKSRTLTKPAYSTRSKEHSGKPKVSGKDKPKLSCRKKLRQAEEKDQEVEEEIEDEDDETLGGFIVDDASDEEEEDMDEDEEEFEQDELEE